MCGNIQREVVLEGGAEVRAAGMKAHLAGPETAASKAILQMNKTMASLQSDCRNMVGSASLGEAEEAFAPDSQSWLGTGGGGERVFSIGPVMKLASTALQRLSNGTASWPCSS